MQKDGLYWRTPCVTQKHSSQIWYWTWLLLQVLKDIFIHSLMGGWLRVNLVWFVCCEMTQLQTFFLWTGAVDVALGAGAAAAYTNCDVTWDKLHQVILLNNFFFFKSILSLHECTHVSNFSVGKFYFEKCFKMCLYIFSFLSTLHTFCECLRFVHDI